MFFKFLCEGFKITPFNLSAKYFVSTGHLTIQRSIRNEMIKHLKCKSIYISQNSYVTYQQYPDERLLNYDIFSHQNMLRSLQKKKV